MLRLFFSQDFAVRFLQLLVFFSELAVLFGQVYQYIPVFHAGLKVGVSVGGDGTDGNSHGGFLTKPLIEGSVILNH